MKQEQVLHSDEGGIVYDPSLVNKPAHCMFTPSFWLQSGQAKASSGGRGSVLFIQPGTDVQADQSTHQQWVLRHYRRGGLPGKLIDDRYLWLGESATRSFREWRLLHRLCELDLPVPQPVAARYTRMGLSYRADLITVAIPHALTLAQSLMNASLTNEQWRAVGSTLARFHAAGVQHADLNAHNIVFDADQAVYVLDFDRGRLRAPGQWHESVLSRLLRSLRKLRTKQAAHFDEAQWSQLLAAHAVALGKPQRASM